MFLLQTDISDKIRHGGYRHDRRQAASEAARLRGCEEIVPKLGTRALGIRAGTDHRQLDEPPQLFAPNWPAIFRWLAPNERPTRWQMEAIRRTRASTVVRKSTRAQAEPHRSRRYLSTELSTRKTQLNGLWDGAAAHDLWGIRAIHADLSRNAYRDIYDHVKNNRRQHDGAN